MDYSAPITPAIDEVFLDIEAIVKEILQICSDPARQKAEGENLYTLMKFYLKKDAQFQQLDARLRHRTYVSRQIDDLKKRVKYEDHKIHCVNECLKGIYDRLLKTRANVKEQTTYMNHPHSFLNSEDVTRCAALQSSAFEVKPSLKAKAGAQAFPFPSVDELKASHCYKGPAGAPPTIPQRHTNVPSMPSRAIVAQPQPSARSSSFMMPPPPLPKSKAAGTAQTSTSKPSKSLPKPAPPVPPSQGKKAKQPKGKKEKIVIKRWLPKKKKYRSILDMMQWNEKALHPCGVIDQKPNTRRAEAEQTSTERQAVPAKIGNVELPVPKRISKQQKHQRFWKMINDDGDDDLFTAESRQPPISPQSCELTDEEVDENIEQWKKAFEVSKQNPPQPPYFLKWVDDRRQKRRAIRPPAFRKIPRGYFWEHSRAKRAVWSAKYGRYYRNHMFRTPRMVPRNYRFADPRRTNDVDPVMNDDVLRWNMRKWALSSSGFSSSG